MIDLAIGAQLVAEAAAWSRARGVPIPEDLRGPLPEAAEIHATLAREAVCLVEAFERDPTMAQGLSGPDALLGGRSARREVLLFKDFHGRVLGRTHEVRDDWRAMRDRYQEEVDAQERGDGPRSLLVEATVTTPGVIEKIGQSIDAARALAR